MTLSTADQAWLDARAHADMVAGLCGISGTARGLRYALDHADSAAAEATKAAAAQRQSTPLDVQTECATPSPVRPHLAIVRAVSPSHAKRPAPRGLAPHLRLVRRKEAAHG